MVRSSENYTYQCFTCGSSRRTSHHCHICGYELPYGSERFWPLIKPGSFMLELGTGLGDTTLFAAYIGTTVVTVDSLEDDHEQPKSDLITPIQYEIYNHHFFEPCNTFDLILIDLNTDIEPTIDFYSRFLNRGGLMIIDRGIESDLRFF